jgi:hypothetical protein
LGDHQTATCHGIAPGDAVDESHAGCATLGVHLDAPDERVGPKRESSRGKCIREDGIERGGDGADLASVHAVCAVVTRHPLAAGFADEQRLPYRNQVEAETTAGPAAKLLGAAECRRRRVEVTVGEHRQAFAGADDADETLDFAVEGRQLLIGERPVGLDPVDRSFSEVVLGKPERDTVPVHASPAEDANTIHEDGIAFETDVSADAIGVERTLLLGPRAAARKFVRPLVSGELAWRHLTPGLEEQHARAGHRQLARRHRPGRSTADDDRVVRLGTREQHAGNDVIAVSGTTLGIV